MRGSASVDVISSDFEGELRVGYLWSIAFVAALGGLLFGYDWIVIGGAKPFYEVYFHLHAEWQVGWANSCALVGCFAGSLIAWPLSEKLGRKGVLTLSALLFVISSIMTGWSHLFAGFIAWRIAGGVAIGLASNISPMYIAEISPAAWRGRLVSLNQLALVIGILIAQIANWRIAQKGAAGNNVCGHGSLVERTVRLALDVYGSCGAGGSIADCRSACSGEPALARRAR